MGNTRYLVLVLFFLSCGSFPKKRLQAPKNIVTLAYQKKYEFVDKAGKFFVHREAGKSRMDKNYVVKKKMYPQGKDKKAIEQSIAIATPGRLKNINIVRPRVAQYTVWFNKKRYFSELKLDVKSKSMILRMDSPEGQWKGIRKIPFPSGTGVYCFFSMIVECVAATGFIEKAVRKGHGKMRFHVIWDGYPYIQEQYQYLPDEVFSSAEFVFEGNHENGEKKFSLTTGGQTILYFVQPEGFLKKIFWIAQGMSMVDMDEGEPI